MSPAARRALAKAVSWRIAGSLDTFLLSFATLTALGPALGLDDASMASAARAGAMIAIAELATKVALYYAHERAWDRCSWGLGASADGRRHDLRRRSFVKTGVWRVLATLDTMALAYLFTGSVAAAAAIGGLETLTKLALYFAHERVWSRIAWGAPDQGVRSV